MIRRALALVVGLSAVAQAAPTRVLLVKRAGVTAYEEVAEEFSERCRVRAQVISFADDDLPLRKRTWSADDLVVTVGQEALDRLRGTPARIIPALAFATPPGLVGPPTAPAPELLLKLLRRWRGKKLGAVGLIYGPRSGARVAKIAHTADRLGVRLLAVRAASGPEAVRRLRELAPQIGALWLPGDPDVVTPQLFQYALRLQLERRLPLVAATRQQVHSGALLAADFSPRHIGRVAAELANRLLGGAPLPPNAHDESGARITVNGAVARRLGLDLGPLLRAGAQVE